MEHFIVRGNPTQVNWTFNNIAGSSFSLEGYAIKLYYSMGNARTLATGVTTSANVITWSFTPDDQWKLGPYDIEVELYQNGSKIITVCYPETFLLVADADALEDYQDSTSTASQNDYSTLNIVSSVDFGRFSAIIPTIGEDGCWYVDGTPVLDPSGEKVHASGRGVTSITKTSTSGNTDLYTIVYTDSTTQSFTITNGIDGSDGADGEDGVGIQSIEKTSTSGKVDTYTITLTNGTTATFNVTNGQDGTDGNDGAAATIGVGNVNVNTAAAGSSASVTITNQGSTSAALLNFAFTIPKGDKGDQGTGLIIKNSVPTTSDLPSASAIIGDAYLCEADNYIYIWNGSSWFQMSTTGYQKPSGGIPSTDLSAAVNTSLGKADTAYQKPSSGIPSTDLSAAVSTSLGKADTALQSHQDISGKADKVSNATNNNFAALDANGNIKDSGKKASDFLTAHQDISGKADKVASPTSGNFAALDSNGNLADSGKKASDFALPSQLPSVMVGASTSAAGAAGLVPAPAAGDNTKYLKGDGTWGTPSGSSVTVDDVPTQNSSNPVKASGLYGVYKYISQVAVVDNSAGGLTSMSLDTSCRVNIFNCQAGTPPNMYLDVSELSDFKEWIIVFLMAPASSGAIKIKWQYTVSDASSSWPRYSVVNGEELNYGEDRTITLKKGLEIHIIDTGSELLFNYTEPSSAS